MRVAAAGEKPDRCGESHRECGLHALGPLLVFVILGRTVMVCILRLSYPFGLERLEFHPAPGTDSWTLGGHIGVHRASVHHLASRAVAADIRSGGTACSLNPWSLRSNL